ncbi:protein translocase subunit SecF [Rhabdothermincola salaria]|uniref:protein translocase subunit SecF n=1 Tax=Rhabdothermincola salaria TaxID=2903142 RepID=UPI001E2E0F76|nr:protein translocase subunit SecF [Rhabdothermincola salaria]MCD9622634.1 protein translocase subunit SecF [Rhabdothermincola salaria]
MTAFARLLRGQSTIDFPTWWKRALVLSALLVLISIGSLFTRGLSLGIDFVGGVSWEVPAPGVSVSDARQALTEVGQEGAKIQIVGDDTLRVQGPEMDDAGVASVREVLADVAGTEVAEVSVSTVGASWGSDITNAAVRALFFFFAAILIYLTIRLEWRMAVAALVAVAHDVLISVGVYSVFQFDVTPGTVIAFLTILGYSIYDTIVVDDKIKENERLVGLSGRMDYTQMVSLSMNQVLLRSINTTITSLLPVISLLVVGGAIMGAVTLQEFALALFVGLAVGAYSSIFVAAPALVWLKEKEPKNQTVRERLAASGGGVSGADPDARGVAAGVRGAKAVSAATTTSTSSSSAGTPSSSAGTGRPKPPTPSSAIPPRPRKKTKKR